MLWGESWPRLARPHPALNRSALNRSALNRSARGRDRAAPATANRCGLLHRAPACVGRLIGVVAGGTLLGACTGPGGPTLPVNVGATHTSAPGEREARPRVSTGAAPERALGESVWANVRQTGFYFHAVVVEHRQDRYRILFDDGSVDWVKAASLRTDTLGPDAIVHVRPRYREPFTTARVARRLGRAVYARFANGQEGWTTLVHVRFRSDARGAPPEAGPRYDGSSPGVSGDAPPSEAPPADAIAPSDLSLAANPLPNVAPGRPAPGQAVWVDYRGGGFLFAATVTARRRDGAVHVVYLDGESGWVSPERVSPDRLQVDARIQVRRRWEPAEWVPGQVKARIGHALHVLFDDGGVAWTSLFRLRVPTR